jgi:3-oxoacid CoA-transferase
MSVQSGELPLRYNKDGSVAEKSQPKETREFNGKHFVLEESYFADYAFVRVAKADKLGNCQFRKAQNNFNEAMAKNAKITFVEADEIVEVGQLAPEEIHLQGVYVSKVIKSTEEKKIEKVTFAKDPNDLLKAGKLSIFYKKHYIYTTNTNTGVQAPAMPLPDANVL